MLLALLLVAHATAEWVEISQQHYRKPIRTHTSYNPFVAPDRLEVEDTTKSWSYNNRSISEYNWNKASIRQPNVERVQYPGTLVKPTEAVSLEGEYEDEDRDEVETRTQEPTKPTAELSDTIKQKAIITRVSNIGNVKRVQLNSTPVKSPFLNINKEKNAKTRYEELPLESEQVTTEFMEHKRRTDTKTNNRRIYVNEFKKQLGPEPTGAFPSENEPSYTEETIKKHEKPMLKNRSDLKQIYSTKPTFITETEDFIQDKYHKPTQVTKQRVSEKKHIFTTESTDIDEEDIEKNTEAPKQSHKQNVKMKDLVKQQTEKRKPHADLDRNDDEEENKDLDKPVKKQNNPINKTETEQEGVREKETLPTKKADPNKKKDSKPDNKVKNMETLLKLMKVVADTISQNTRRSFGGKMRYLLKLKDSILANIAERIDATWPDDEAGSPHRHSRSAHRTARGHHVNFPSSESALMTISFLTFAVFLIKLILQVIHTYKNKTMMVAPVMVATGRAAFARGKQ